MTDFVFIYITNPTKKTARKIAKYLLEKRLIACANIFPISSIYHWKGKIVDEAEYVLIAKTLEENFKKVKDEVKKIHPYTVPCIIKIRVSSNKEYFKWLKGELKKNSS